MFKVLTSSLPIYETRREVFDSFGTHKWSQLEFWHDSFLFDCCSEAVNVDSTGCCVPIKAQ